MHFNKALRLLVVSLSAMSVAEATFAGAGVAGSGAKGLQRRQLPGNVGGADNADNADNAGGAANTGDATATSSDPPPEETSTPPPEQTTTSDPESTSTTSSSSSKEDPPPTTTSSSQTSTQSQTSSKPTSTSSEQETTRSSSSQPPKTTSSSSSHREPTTYVITHIVTSTRGDGSPVTYTSETKTTETPGLADGESGQESGMPTQTRNTVIGVVVGVGGAIILAGLALVAWRIWGRKKHQEENDGLMDYGSHIESKPDTSGSTAGRTPFQSTLESYHAPTQVNSAANF
ncbi:hypothetical protein B0J18DRAFT_95276 [Chaetomium sp. MPI-SDFR-AT-0129]|uniref:Mid2 domain-containing protein n=1 Tax=Dichotomopilus funicola TaxID=1934379 RepID=A0AAN6V6E0_9PEZI|nr:hypothetical protein B0J18DRAFT_95276 [Chaetomium sp. MPI-SDFR-AT-0129]KAK4145309.1 hypothetical protein C8A04DRAFT_26814 [Dichotomopilus funicola]